MASEVTNRLLTLVDDPAMAEVRDDLQAAIRHIQRLGDTVLELGDELNVTAARLGAQIDKLRAEIEAKDEQIADYRMRIHHLNEELLTRGR